MSNDAAALSTELLPSVRAAGVSPPSRVGDPDGASKPPSWMLIRLALETRDHHRQADADRLTVMEATTRAEYRAFLARVFGFEAATEAALLAVHDVAPSVITACAKAQRVREDLRALGMTDQDIDSLPRCSMRPHCSAAAAFGWLFVNERLTLLSGLIRRHLARVLPAEIETASAYFRAYGERAGAHFRELGEVLGHHACRSAGNPGEMVAAAHEAFHAQRQWFARRSRFRYPTQPRDFA